MNEEQLNSSLEPQMVKAKKLLLIVSIVGMVMFFAGLMSMHLVSKGAAAFWVKIKMPPAFWWSTVIMVMSSLTMALAVKAVKRNDKQRLKVMLALSLVLGLGFIYSQMQGWSYMAERGLYLRGDFLEHLKGEYYKDYYIINQQGLKVEYKDGHYYDPMDPSGTRIIDEELETFSNPASRNLITLSGLHALHVGGGILWLIYLVIMAFVGRLSRKNALKVTQGAVYWHFVDLLWLILLLFLYINH